MGQWESECMPDDGYVLELGCRDQHVVKTRVLHPPRARVECGQDDMSDVLHRVAVGHKVRLDADERGKSKTGVGNVAAEVDVDPVQVREVPYICAIEDGHEAVLVSR
jgi:hypothetical protein